MAFKRYELRNVNESTKFERLLCPFEEAISQFHSWTEDLDPYGKNKSLWMGIAAQHNLDRPDALKWFEDNYGTKH